MSLVFCGENQCYFGNSAAWTWMVAVWCHSDVGVSHLPQLEVYLREHVAQESADLRRQSWAECGSDRCESAKMKQVLFSLHWGPVRHAPLDQIRHCSFVSRTQSCFGFANTQVWYFSGMLAAASKQLFGGSDLARSAIQRALVPNQLQRFCFDWFA